MSDYRKVKPTAEERAAWRDKNGTAFQPPYRVECVCGQRLWLSGFSIGAHRRKCELARRAYSGFPVPFASDTKEGDPS